MGVEKQKFTRATHLQQNSPITKVNLLVWTQNTNDLCICNTQRERDRKRDTEILTYLHDVAYNNNNVCN